MNSIEKRVEAKEDGSEKKISSSGPGTIYSRTKLT